MRTRKSIGVVYAAQPIFLFGSTARMVAEPQYLIERVRDKIHVSRFLLQASQCSTNKGLSGHIHSNSDMASQSLVDKRSRLGLSLACLQSCLFQFDAFARFKDTRLCCTLSMPGFRLRYYGAGGIIEALNFNSYTFDSVPATEYSANHRPFFVCQDLVVQDRMKSLRYSCSCCQVWCVRP